MNLLDRNSADPSRLRRNMQRFAAGAADSVVPITPSSGIYSTSSGLATSLYGAPTGSLLWTNSTGSVDTLPPGPSTYVLTVLDSTGDLGWASTGGGGGGSTTVLASTGISVSTSGTSTWVTNTAAPASTFYVLPSTGIGISTSGTSTWVTNTEAPGSTFYVLPSTGIGVSTSGTSTWVTNTEAPGSTFYVLAGSGISTSVSGTSTKVSTLFDGTTLSTNASNQLTVQLPHTYAPGYNISVSTTASTKMLADISLPAGFACQSGHAIALDLVFGFSAATSSTETFNISLAYGGSTMTSTGAQATGDGSPMMDRFLVNTTANASIGFIAASGALWRSNETVFVPATGLTLAQSTYSTSVLPLNVYGSWSSTGPNAFQITGTLVTQFS